MKILENIMQLDTLPINWKKEAMSWWELQSTWFWSTTLFSSNLIIR